MKRLLETLQDCWRQLTGWPSDRYFARITAPRHHYRTKEDA